LDPSFAVRDVEQGCRLNAKREELWRMQLNWYVGSVNKFRQLWMVVANQVKGRAESTIASQY